jgi:tetratricopeptide (TPR) repeat protein
MLGEYVMALENFPEDVESSDELMMSCLRLAGNELVNLNRGNESISLFVQFLSMLHLKERFLGKPFHEQCEILQTYSFSNPYYVFYSLGFTYSETENIDAAIQCYERCIELDEDFTCDQDIVVTLSELYQTKALTADLENNDLRTSYMDLARKLFEKLFQKIEEMTTFVELRFASLLSKLGRYEEAVGHFNKVIERADYESFFSFGNVDKPLVDVFIRREIEAHDGSIFMSQKVLAVYELISTYVKLDKMEKAQELTLILESVAEIYRSTSEYPLVRSMVGYAYKLIGNKEKSAEIFVSILEVIPGHPPVTEALETCCV